MIRFLRNAFVCLVAGLTGSVAMADDAMRLNMSPGVTPISHDLYNLHMTTFFVVCAIGAVVFGLLIFTIIRYRKSRGVKAAHFHGSTKIEILWTVIPFILLVILAVPATYVLLRMSDDSHSAVNIKIVGYQWKWKYEYLDNGISYFSNLSTPQDQLTNQAPKNKHYLLEVDKPLVVPIHTKIRFLVTSNDVIHSWWMPDFGIKRDAIPGFVHEAWAIIDKPGIYRGQCAELCGLNHGFMPIVVVAKPVKAYDQWVQAMEAGKNPPFITEADRKASGYVPPINPNTYMTKSELMKLGQEVFQDTCAQCHRINGRGMPPAFPALMGSKVVTGPIAEQIKLVLNGRDGTAMQAFRNKLTNNEIAAVITYVRNSWGNDDQAKYGKYAGGVAQPTEVAKIRKETK